MIIKTDPEFALFEFFEGEVLAWGLLQDRSGQQTRRFEVQIQGEIQGQLLTLTEDFVFDDGEKQQRIWKITARADGTYIGEADDVIGEANGVVAGNALHWQYVLRVPVDDTLTTSVLMTGCSAKTTNACLMSPPCLSLELWAK